MSLIDIGIPLFSDVARAISKEHIRLELPTTLGLRSLYVKIKVLDDKTAKVREIYLHKSGVEDLGIGRDLLNYPSMHELLGHKITSASFFSKLKFPGHIVHTVLKMPTKVTKTSFELRNFLSRWGFQQDILEAVEKAGYLSLLALMQKLDFDFAYLEGIPSNFSSEFLPLPSLDIDYSLHKGYRLLLHKAQLRRSGFEEFLLLEKGSDKIARVFKETYSCFKEEKGVEIIYLKQMFSKKDVKTLYLLGLFDLFYERVIKHGEEISELVKKEGSAREILKILTKNHYLSEWMLFRAEAFDILSNRGNSSAKPELTELFDSWLMDSTCFDETLARELQDFSVVKSRVRKKQLKSAFLLAERALFKGKGTAMPFRARNADGEASYIAYKTETGKTALCKWSGCWNKSDICSSKLGEGTYGVVQKIQCLATGRLMALKSPHVEDCSDETRKKYAVRSIQNEIGFLTYFAGLPVSDSGRFNRLTGVIVMDGMTALMREYREMDLVDAFLNEKQFEVTLRGVYLGLLDVLYSLELLARHEKAHLDLRGDNILCDYDPGIKGFKCFLDDFGISLSYNKIIRLKTTMGYGKKFSLKSDNDKLDALFGTKKKSEIKRLLEKREVYAFGIMAFDVLSYHLISMKGNAGRFNKEFSNLHGKEMTSCLIRMHKHNPDERPTFREIIQCFEKILNSDSSEDIQRLNRRFATREKAPKERGDDNASI